MTSGSSSDALDLAVSRVREGGLVAYSTETLWGLGADALSETAMARLRRWKGRGETHPVAVLVEGVEALPPLGIALPDQARALAEAFWPGPLTLVLPAHGRFAAGVARERDGAVGVRCSAHPLAAAFAERLGAAGVGPVTSTSLNRTGRPPARNRSEAAALCAGDADAPWLLDDATAPAPGGLASSVVDLTVLPPRLLRAGALARAVLERVAGPFEESA